MSPAGICDRRPIPRIGGKAWQWQQQVEAVWKRADRRLGRASFRHGDAARKRILLSGRQCAHPTHLRHPSVYRMAAEIDRGYVKI